MDRAQQSAALALHAGCARQQELSSLPKLAGFSNVPPLHCPQWPSGFFLLGVALVLLSVFMYGKAVNSDTPRALWHWCRKVRFSVLSARGLVQCSLRTG